MSGDLISRVKKRTADRAATTTVRRSAPDASSPVPLAGQLTGGVGDLVESTRKSDPLGGRTLPADVSAGLHSRRGQGTPLPDGLAAVAGRHIGRDLSGVRLHTDAGADRLARSVQAQAFTQGSDIYFSRGSFDPDSSAGSHLLAHELAHVAQGSNGAGPVIGRADDPAEAAADRVADRVAPALRHLRTTPSADTPGHGAADHRPGAAGPIHRKISKTARDIEALRGDKGTKKGARKKDTLHRIGALVDLIPRLEKQEKVIAGLDLVVGLCRHWLEKYGTKQEPALVALVQDILAEAHRDWGIAQAQARYVNDARAGSQQAAGGQIPRTRDTPLTYRPTTTPMMMGIGESSITSAAGYETVKTDQMKVHPINQQTHKAYLVKMAGLTEAEILALTKFSAGDFTYINPAMESQVRHEVDGRPETGGWMRSQMTAIQKSVNQTDASWARKPRGVGYDQLVEEGTLHAGVAMQALAKLTPKRGTVFRGERMTPANFDKLYAGAPTTTFHSFKSMTTNRETAENYALNGVLGNDVKPEQSLSVLVVFEVDDARDIKPFSEIPAENEWLLLPGSSFQLNGIRDVAKGKQPDRAGVPPVSEWKVVRLRQRPGRPTAALPRGR